MGSIPEISSKATPADLEGELRAAPLRVLLQQDGNGIAWGHMVVSLGFFHGNALENHGKHMLFFKIPVGEMEKPAIFVDLFRKPWVFHDFPWVVFTKNLNGLGWLIGKTNPSCLVWGPGNLWFSGSAPWLFMEIAPFKLPFATSCRHVPGTPGTPAVDILEGILSDPCLNMTKKTGTTSHVIFS